MKKNIKKKPYNSLNSGGDMAKKEKSPVIESPASISLNDIIKSVWFVPLLALSALVAVFAIRQIANPDIGFHLAAGRWIVQNFAVPHKDIFTYTVSANDYIDIQWLYQVVLFLVQNIIGYAGLTILNMLVLLTMFYLLFRRMNLEGVPVYISIITILTGIIAIQIRFSYRPEIATWIFILLTLYVLDRYLYSGKGKLFWLPVIMLFWVNMHGLFIIGLFIIGVYFISAFYHDKKPDYNLLKWFGVSIAAVLVNPYFIEGALFPFYLFTRLQKGNIFQSTITELKSPWIMVPGFELELYIYYAITFLSLILFIASYKNRKVHQAILLISFFYISYSSFRNVPVFIIYAVQIIAVSLRDIVKTGSMRNFFTKLSRYKKIVSGALAVVFILIAVRVVTGAYYWKYNSGVKFGFGIDKAALPEDASDFMAANLQSGKIINKLEFGGWLDWKWKQPVFIDGRLEVVKEDFYSEYMNGLKINGLKYLMNKYKPEIVVNDVDNVAWTNDVKSLPGGKLVYFDNTAAVYVKDGFSNLPAFDFFSAVKNAGIDINIFDDNYKTSLINNTKVYSSSDWIKGFYSYQCSSVELKRMGNFAMDNQRFDIAELCFMEFLKRSNGILNEGNYYDVFNNLGSIYYTMKKFALSESCYENYLKVNPDDNAVRQRVAELKQTPK